MQMPNTEIQNLESRIRQLMANDRNAAEIYSFLSKQAVDDDISKRLAALAKVEAGHMALDREVLDLIEKEKPE
jgi:rubrerythrin